MTAASERVLPPGARGRSVRLFLDSVKNLDFHGSFADAAEQHRAKLADSLDAPLELEVHESFGSWGEQRKLVVDLATQLARDSDDLICLFPTDSYAITDLQSALFLDPPVHPGRVGRQNLVCAVAHQMLSEVLQEDASSKDKRLFGVGADQVLMGKLQADQILRLLSRRTRRDRRIIYVSGPGHSSATRLRIAGAVEKLLENKITVEATHAEWDGSKAKEALTEWRQAGGSLADLDAIAAQNDQIANAAKSWLMEAGRGDVPVVGMDGTDRLGRRLVREGRLAATVVQPLGVAEVFDTYKALVLGEMSVAELHARPNIRLEPTSIPPVAELVPLGA